MLGTSGGSIIMDIQCNEARRSLGTHGLFFLALSQMRGWVEHNDPRKDPGGPEGLLTAKNLFHAHSCHAQRRLSRLIFCESVASSSHCNSHLVPLFFPIIFILSFLLGYRS